MGLLGAMLGDCCCPESADAVGLGGLGDIVCTPAEVSAAQQALTTLSTTFTNAGAPAKWQNSVDAVKNVFSQLVDTSTTLGIPSPQWMCQAKQAGQLAQELAGQIAKDQGLPAPPTSPYLNDSPGFFSSAGKIILVGLGIAIIGGSVLTLAEVGVKRHIRKRTLL